MRQNKHKQTHQQQTLTVTSQDVELAVSFYPNDNKPTLLFLHGFPDCQKTWDHQIAGLQKDYAIITFDMRGVGQSTWSGQRNSYTMARLLEDIEAVILAVLGPDGQVHLVAHDWGSVIGWSFICDPYYSRRVLSYTSMSGPHLGLMLDWVRRNLVSGNPWRIARALKQGAFSWYVYLFNVPLLPEWLFRSFGKTIWKTALQTNGVAADDEYLDQSPQQVTGICVNALNLYRQNPWSPPPVPAKNSIQLPVQLLIPNEDKFISDQLFEFYDDYVAELYRHPIQGKHWAHHSHRNIFNERVDTFVQSIEANQHTRAA